MLHWGHDNIHWGLVVGEDFPLGVDNRANVVNTFDKKANRAIDNAAFFPKLAPIPSSLLGAELGQLSAAYHPVVPLHHKGEKHH